MVRYITFKSIHDGVGAQVQDIFSILVFAKHYNLTYIYAPFKKIDHNMGNDSKWVFKWNQFFSLNKLGSAQTKLSFLRKLLTKKVVLSEQEIENFDINKYPENVIFICLNCHAFTEKKASFGDFVPIINEFRKCYGVSKYLKDAPSFSKSEINVAVHIRRGDALKFPERILPNSYFVKILDKEIKKLGQKKYKVFIFSEGSEDDFDEFKKFKNLVFKLDASPFSSFNYLVKSDILIISKSSFSFVAGILNKNRVVYAPFWHKPVSPRWTICDVI